LKRFGGGPALVIASVEAAVRIAPLVVPLPVNTTLPPVDVTVILPSPTSDPGCPMRLPAADPPFSVTSPLAVTVIVPVWAVVEFGLGPIADPAFAAEPPFIVIVPPFTLSVTLVGAFASEPIRAPEEPVAVPPAPVIVRLPLTVTFWFSALMLTKLSTPPVPPVIVVAPNVRVWVAAVSAWMRAKLPLSVEPPLVPAFMMSAAEWDAVPSLLIVCAPLAARISA